MFGRISRQVPRRLLSNPHTHSRSFSSPAFNDFSRRLSDLENKYPGLYGDLAGQESLLSANQSNLESLVSQYEQSRESIDNATGERVFLPLSVDDLRRNPPSFVSRVVNTPEQAELKLARGQKLVDELVSLKERENDGSIEDQNKCLIRIGELADELQDWRARLPDDLDDFSEMGLPINDHELDLWVEKEYAHAPDNVRVDSGTMAEHRVRENEWFQTLDTKLGKQLAERDPNFDESKWAHFCQISNEMFHPHEIDHYFMSDYSKLLFRAALWQSEDRLKSVEDGIDTCIDLFNDARDNDFEIIRKMYEQTPDMPFANLVALQLQAADPLFAAKLADDVRARLEGAAFDRAVKDVLKPIEMPFLLEDKKHFETALQDEMSINRASHQRSLGLVEAEIASYDEEIPSIEDTLEGFVDQKCWGNDSSQVSSALTSYAKGSGDLSGLDRAIQSTLNPGTESGKMNDTDILRAVAMYHNARIDDKNNWSFKTLIESADTGDVESVLDVRRCVKRRLASLGVDPLVINLVRLMVEDGAADDFMKAAEGFKDVMKKYRGEVDAVVMSAEELDDDTFNQISQALASANAGKKITLSRQVEPGLGAGFVVKAGVQKFDFSLAAHIDAQRRQRNL